ncbi:MAG: hypothetical protein WBV82_12945, partial [Myxococcaceae bacterium]
LWTPWCHNGHGSPWPFFYHRLFTTLSGALAVVFGTPWGVMAAIVLVLTFGGLGTMLAAKELGASRPLQVAAGFLWTWSSYAWFDWLIRGAGAEFTAYALVPWLLLVVARLPTHRHAGWQLGLVLSALFYAHLVIFLYAFPVLLTVFGQPLRGGLRGVVGRTATAAAVVLVLAGPYALLIQLLQNEFNLSALAMFRPSNEYVDWHRYLYESKFALGETWQGNFVEIGPGLLAAVLLSSGYVAVARRGRMPRAWIAFAALAFFYGVLQFPVSAAFYERVPFAQLLQFPWRLLCFITPLLILMLVISASAVQAQRPVVAYALVAIAVAFALVRGIQAQRIDYPWFDGRFIAQHLAALDHPWSAREYLPWQAQGAVPHRTPPISLEGCGDARVAPADAMTTQHHFGRVTLRTRSERTCVITLGQFKTRFLNVDAPPGAEVRVSDGGLTQVVLPPGEHEVRVDAAGFWELLWERVLQPTGHS